MAKKLIITYDRVGDILSLDKCVPYVGQDSEHLEDDIVVRLNPETDEVENLEILWFLKRIQDGEKIELPLNATLLLAEE